MLQIVKVPNSVLTSAARPVGHIDKKTNKLLQDMEETLRNQTDPQGVGLAAPQVGVDLQIFIMLPEPEQKITVYINPIILEQQGKKSPLEKPVTKGSSAARKKNPKLEGCLSIPRIWAPVERYPKVLLEYQDEKSLMHKKWFQGFEAIIVQHEVDHLQGILFTQRALEEKSQIYEEKDGELVKANI